MVQLTAKLMVEWLLNKARLGRADLAQRLKVHESTISRWLSGCPPGLNHFAALDDFYREVQGTLAINPAGLLPSDRFEFLCSDSPRYKLTHRPAAEADLERFLATQEQFLFQTLFKPDRNAGLDPTAVTGPAATLGFSMHAFPADVTGPARAHVFRADLRPHPVLLVLYDRTLAPPARRDTLGTELAHVLNEVDPPAPTHEVHRTFIARVRRPRTPRRDARSRRRPKE